MKKIEAIKVVHYSFSVKTGEPDIIRLKDSGGKTYEFSMSHPGFVRFAINVNVIARESTPLLDFLEAECREN